MKKSGRLFTGVLFCLGASIGHAQDAGSSISTSSVGASSVAAPRTASYGSVVQGNLAADFTTADYLMRPHLMKDLQFISLEGGSSIYNGTIAFQANNFTWFGNGTQTEPGHYSIRAGLAQGGNWGAGLVYNLYSGTFVSPGGGIKETTVHLPGHGLGLFGSYNLGMGSIYAEISYNTGDILGEDGDELTEFEPVPAPGTTPSDIDRSDKVLGLKVGFIHDTQGQGSHAYGAEFILNRASGEEAARTAPTVVGKEEATNTAYGIKLMHGLPIVYNSDFAVFVGATGLLYYGTTEDGTADSSTFGIVLNPNIAAQKVLGKGFSVSMGASAGAFNWSRSSNEPKAAGSDETIIRLLETSGDGPFSMTASADFGLRWEKGNFAVEGQLSRSLLHSGPNFITGTQDDLFLQVGVIAGF